MKNITKKKILILLPIKKNQVFETLSLKELLEHIDPITMDVTVASLTEGPDAIESRYGVDIAASCILQEVLKVSANYDAIIINCILDPAFESARQISKALVTTPLHSSLALAKVLGENIGILTLVKSIFPEISKLVKQYGYNAQVKYVDALSTKDYKSKMFEEAQKMVDSGVDVIILGITGFIGIAKEIEAKVNVPVIDPSVAAFKLTNCILDMRLSHSKAKTDMH